MKNESQPIGTSASDSFYSQQINRRGFFKKCAVTSVGFTAAALVGGCDETDVTIPQDCWNNAYTGEKRALQNFVRTQAAKGTPDKIINQYVVNECDDINARSKEVKK